jgi:hypothetical protein
VGGGEVDVGDGDCCGCGGDVGGDTAECDGSEVGDGVVVCFFLGEGGSVQDEREV